MIRIFELLVALLIVFVLAVVIGVMLPSHGHIEREVEVSSPVRQVYDSLNNFRRFPQWSWIRAQDPNAKMSLQGPEAGTGAKISWSSTNPRIGDGNLTITSSTQDSKLEMALDNDWNGTNKIYTVQLHPASNGKTLKINETYDVDYGWDLKARYAGLYIDGDPAASIQTSLNNLSAMLAGFPNIDYKDQKIDPVDIVAKPVFVVSTKAKRSLDEVAAATDTAMAEIEAAMKKAGLTAAGPRMTITTEWGDEDYSFSVAVPVSAATFALDGQQMTIEAPMPPAAGTDEDSEKVYAPGEKDEKGLLVVDNNVRAALWYQGVALYTEYTGSPAVLPLIRLSQKAFAETHGYKYQEIGLGRFWDEVVSAPDAPEDQRTYRVYMPIQR
ncbi:MAG: polyketide cyclase [Dokdonella sp.]|uniref:polyketide cyclase n=1 Tax=Dokdonella sp. TaxID=2291710 RepID=UPI00326636BD